MRGYTLSKLIAAVIAMLVMICATWTQPVEASADWSWSNPLPQGYDLNGVWGASTGESFAVGDYGAIVRFNGSSWEEMVRGHGQDLNHVWGTSATNVYAVGNYGTVMHYDGSAWSAFPPITSQHLYRVWGSGPGDIFAVGDKGMIIRYNGLFWKIINAGVKAEKLHDVWGTSPTDVYACGYVWDDIYPKWAGILYHYNGTSWTLIVNDLSVHEFERIWGTSPANLYVVGRDRINVKDCIKHFDGTAWTVILEKSGDIIDFLGFTDSDMYIIWGQAVYHYNGITWTGLINSPDLVLRDLHGRSGSDVFVVGDHGGILHYKVGHWLWESVQVKSASSLWHAWGSSESDIYAGGQSTLLYYDGMAWSSVPLGTGSEINGIWGTGPDNVYTVGYGSGTPYFNGKITRYDGTTWSHVVDVSLNKFDGIWGSSANDIFVAGNERGTDYKYYGNLYHYDGVSWSVILDGYGWQFYDLWGFGSDEIYIVAETGVLHYNGTTLTTMFPQPGSIYNLRTVWGFSETDFYVISNIRLYHYNGTSWKNMHDVESYTADVWGTSSSDLYFARGQAEGTIVHYNGSTWSTVLEGPRLFLYGVWGTSATNIYAYGGNGFIFHYRGSSVIPALIPAGIVLVMVLLSLLCVNRIRLYPYPAC